MSMTPDSGGTGTGQAQQELDRARSEAGHIASEAAEAAKERGREQFDNVKRRTADRAEELADAIDSTASDLESSDTGSAVSGYGHSMAEMMRRFAGGLREQEIEEFASQLALFAPRSPGSFLAGSVALGFGVSRFLKATSQRSAEHYRDDRWADDEDDLEEEYLFDEEDELDTTLEPSASPEVSRYTPGEPWPEDRSNETPGTASPTQPASSAIGQPPRSEYTAGATGAAAADSNLEGDAERRDISGGQDRE
jgi:vacuolar-type H+-ATPase subunit H